MRAWWKKMNCTIPDHPHRAFRLDLGGETPGELSSPVVPNDDNNHIQRQAMLAAQNAEENPN